MSKEYDFLIYIGRFQPFHMGHQYVMEEALDRAKRVIVMVGSSDQPITPKNPFTYKERREMIMSVYRDKPVIVEPLPDFLYNDQRWLGAVQSTLTDIILQNGNKGVVLDGMKDFKIGIIGHHKDASTYYLNLFPTWDFIEVSQWGTVNATDLRENFFQRAPRLPDHLCHPNVIEFLHRYMITPQFKYIVEESRDLEHIKSRWRDAPYEPHFVTADAVVTQSGHVLLVKRGQAPGRGLLALPGGHIVPSVGDAFDNCIKELWEEARPSDGHSDRNKPMPKNRLRGFYTGLERRFDMPGRDPRGYYCTHAFRFEFPPGKLWKVTGGLAIEGEENDVVEAAWYPISSIRPDNMFADHYFIIQNML